MHFSSTSSSFSLWKIFSPQYLLGILSSILGSFTLAGAIFSLHKVVFQSTPQVYLPHSDAWQEAWRQQFSPELQENTQGHAFVEIAGAVEKPGVYQVSGDSRLQEVFLQAGGFHSQADQRYIHQSLNLARRVADQEKVYVPFQGEDISIHPADLKNNTNVSVEKNVNMASSSDLMSVAGIGTARATKILEGQPYSSREDFFSRSGLSENLAKSVLEVFSL